MEKIHCIKEIHLSCNNIPEEKEALLLWINFNRIINNEEFNHENLMKVKKYLNSLKSLGYIVDDYLKITENIETTIN